MTRLIAHDGYYYEKVVTWKKQATNDFYLGWAVFAFLFTCLIVLFVLIYGRAGDWSFLASLGVMALSVFIFWNAIEIWMARPQGKKVVFRRIGKVRK